MTPHNKALHRSGGERQFSFRCSPPPGELKRDLPVSSKLSQNTERSFAEFAVSYI